MDQRESRRRAEGYITRRRRLGGAENHLTEGGLSTYSSVCNGPTVRAVSVTVGPRKPARAFFVPPGARLRTAGALPLQRGVPCATAAPSRMAVGFRKGPPPGKA